jgi:hypothetical protein
MVYLIRRILPNKMTTNKRRKKDASGLLLYVWKRRLGNDTRNKSFLGSPLFGIIIGCALNKSECSQHLKQKRPPPQEHKQTEKAE